MWNLYKKELFSYLHSMLAYVFIAFFVAAGGIYYSHYCLTSDFNDEISGRREETKDRSVAFNLSC